MTSQRTLRRVVPCAGIGLHSGRKVTLSLRPAPADYGIRFKRVDLGGVEIPAHVSHLGGRQQLQTGLAVGQASVETVEHLLAALSAMGVDNALVELNHPEVPIMDGSSAPWVYLIQDAGVKDLGVPRKTIQILRQIQIQQGDKRIALFPADRFRVSYTISFDHPLLRHQQKTMDLDEQAFVDEIAPARTFGFLKEVEMLRQRGLALGGSLENAIVLGETGVLNPLRFEDEFVRHKILDVDWRPGARRPPDPGPPGRASRRPRAAHGASRPKCCVSATPGSSSTPRPRPAASAAASAFRRANWRTDALRAPDDGDGPQASRLAAATVLRVST